MALCVLLTVSLAFGWRNYETRSAQRSAIQASERARWLAQRERSPNVAANHGVFVIRPVPLLSTLEPGVDSFLGIATHAQEHQHFFVWKPAEDEFVAHRFGEFSVASVFQFVVPLLIIILLYSAFTRDRETGILRLTMSVGVKRWHYVLGKLLGNMAPVLVLVPVFIAMTIALRVIAGEVAFAAEAPALAWMGLSYLLLGAAFTATSLGSSATATTSRASLLSLLLCWCLTCFIVPHLAIALEARLSPTPTAADVLQVINDAEASEPTAADEFRDIVRELTQKYHVADLAHLPLHPTGIRRSRQAIRQEPISTAAYGLAYNSYLSHDRLMQWISAASPNLAVQNISSSLAGVGPDAFVDLAHAVETYRYALNETMNRDIAEHANPLIPGGKLADEFHRGIEVWSQVPAFAFRPAGVKMTILRQQVAWLMLTLWCVLAIAFAGFRISRMGVDA